MWVWGFGNHKWHESKTSDLTRLLYHAWFPKLHTHISALTVLALLKNTNKQKETTNERRYPFQSSMFSYMTVKVNIVTCEYIDFHLTAGTAGPWQPSIYFYILVNVLKCEYVHWLNNCAIAFNLHDKLFNSFAIIVILNNGTLMTKINQ